MAVYRNLWTLIKNKLDADTALQAYLGMPVIWGRQDKDFTGFPVLCVDLSDRPIGESPISVPKRRTGRLTIFVGIKVRGQDTAQLIVDILQGIELVLNALDSLYPNALLLTVDIPGEVLVSTLANDIKDATISATLESQPFIMANR